MPLILGMLLFVIGWKFTKWQITTLVFTEIDLFEIGECENSQEIDVNLDVENVDVETIFSTKHEEKMKLLCRHM